MLAVLGSLPGRYPRPDTPAYDGDGVSLLVEGVRVYAAVDDVLEA